MPRRDMIGVNRMEVYWHLPDEDTYHLGIFGFRDGDGRSRAVYEAVARKCMATIKFTTRGREHSISLNGSSAVALNLETPNFMGKVREIISAAFAENGWHRANIFVDISELPRVIVGSLFGFLHHSKLYRRLVFAYRCGSYEINGSAAQDVYDSDAFLRTIIDMIPPCIPIPYVGGRYHSSARRYMFMSCGLDARLWIPRLRAFEPYRTDVILPNVFRDTGLMRNVQLGLLENSNAHIEFMSPQNVFDFLESLRRWAPLVEDGAPETQGMVFSVGWKTHHLIACIWSAAEAQYPVLTTREDFVADVTVTPTDAFVTLVLTNVAAV